MRNPQNDAIVDYDADGYDYRGYWDSRAYEQWAEDRALRRLGRRLGPARWFADFGGAFGRNAGHYLDRTDHAVILDYSATNLANAARRHARALDAGQLHLVRCDLNAIPFRDHTFDAAMVVRVLHHLADLPRGLTEMARTVAGTWLVDVPVKHHVLGLVRAARHGRAALGRVRDAEPMLVGAQEPYWNFQLAAVREQLRQLGWRPRVAASVNNLRRFDRALPGPLARMVRPAAYGTELLLQRAGRGWWGPSQLVLTERYDRPRTFEPAQPNQWSVSDTLAPLAARMACPACLRGLEWSESEAWCPWCCITFQRAGGYWDFVLDTAKVRVVSRPLAVSSQPGPTEATAPGSRPASDRPTETAPEPGRGTSTRPRTHRQPHRRRPTRPTERI